MKSLLVLSTILAFVPGAVLPASAHVNRIMNQPTRYTTAMCHQKIDTKGLSGRAKKDAWKACRESPDTYN